MAEAILRRTAGELLDAWIREVALVNEVSIEQARKAVLADPDGKALEEEAQKELHGR